MGVMPSSLRSSYERSLRRIVCSSLTLIATLPLRSRFFVMQGGITPQFAFESRPVNMAPTDQNPDVDVDAHSRDSPDTES